VLRATFYERAARGRLEIRARCRAEGMTYALLRFLNDRWDIYALPPRCTGIVPDGADHQRFAVEHSETQCKAK